VNSENEVDPETSNVAEGKVAKSLNIKNKNLEVSGYKILNFLIS
jgi:hypothetical protein